MTCYVVRIACEESAHAILKTRHAKQSILQKLNDKKKEKIIGAFTACTAGTSLLETVTDAAEIAPGVGVVLLSTARSSFDEFQNARKCGQNLCILVKSISWGDVRGNPNITGGITGRRSQKMMNFGKTNFSFRGFLREKHETNNSITQTSLQKGR
jgi:hypothetical protein